MKSPFQCEVTTGPLYSSRGYFLNSSVARRNGPFMAAAMIQRPRPLCHCSPSPSSSSNGAWESKFLKNCKCVTCKAAVKYRLQVFLRSLIPQRAPMLELAVLLIHSPPQIACQSSQANVSPTLSSSKLRFMKSPSPRRLRGYRE